MLMATQGPAVFYGVTITLTLVNIIVVPMRFHRRNVARQKLKIDDWLTVPALTLNIGMSVATWVGVARHAVGYPTPAGTITARTPIDQANATIAINEQTFFIVFCMFSLSLALSKSSILFFYRRIFCPNHLWYDFMTISISFMIAIVVMFGLGVTFSYVFSCGTHFSYWWVSAGSTLIEHCINTQMLTYAQCIADFIIDVIIIAMPIVPVWRLHLSTKRKFGVIAVFLTAGLAVAASLIKMIWFLWENQTPWNPSFDQDELSSTLMFWTIMETHVALIAACLPTLRQCFTGHNYIDSVLRSIRSTISINSLRSTKSRTESEGNSFKTKSEEVQRNSTQQQQQINPKDESMLAMPHTRDQPLEVGPLGIAVFTAGDRDHRVTEWDSIDRYVLSLYRSQNFAGDK